MVSAPWCHSSVTPVPAMGPCSGYSPWDAFWDGGPPAFGILVLPQGLGRSDAEPRPWAAPRSPHRPPEQSTRGCARHRGACRWTRHQGYNHGGSTRSHAHSGHDRARPTRAPALSHPRVDTLPTCTYPRLAQAPSYTEPFRATWCLTGPYRAVRSLTGPYRAARGRCGAHARARSFTRPRRGNEPRAPRAGSAAPRWLRPSLCA